MKSWKLGWDFIPPSEELRTRITEWRARTSLAVDASSFQILLRNHDSLDVLCKWALIRGQVEPRVWAEIDRLVVEIGLSKLESDQQDRLKDRDSAPREANEKAQQE